MPPEVPTPRMNPRGGDRKGRPFGGRMPSTAIWYILAFVVVLSLAQLYLAVPAGRQLPYSEFKELVATDGVADVVIGEFTIRGTLRESEGDVDQPSTFTTTR